MVRNRGRVTRFVVMAVLQAARARVLGLPEESAYSWGLNRAIFYAAAKRGFRGTPSAGGTASDARPESHPREVFRLGDEEAFRGSSQAPLVFRIGDSDQTVAEFEKEIVARFGNKENFRAAWNEAVHLIESQNRSALESQRRFYDEVYRPRRDDLSDTWTGKYSPSPREG